ncbi:voltage-dependent calcium channel subunit alpha-2/delta-3-like, partial [Leptonychotes weddellii]|uniref:Voltage-dependent calcium channel subunit alpha-2/delta-3-like n=1 Tax=Leptonychotes weddellii TaxID=9713 RepID=A0A7F8Q374_LEPWE
MVKVKQIDSFLEVSWEKNTCKNGYDQNNGVLPKNQKIQKYKEYEKDVAIEEIDGLQLVKKLAKNMEEMFHKKSEAMRRLVEAAEEAHLKHEFDADLQYEYFNAVLINERDKDGNFLELGKEFILAPNDHFNNLPVNISLSDVQVPTNMYNKAAEMYFVLRGPAGSDLLIDDMYSEHVLRAWSLAGCALP